MDEEEKIKAIEVLRDRIKYFYDAEQKLRDGEPVDTEQIIRAICDDIADRCRDSNENLIRRLNMHALDMSFIIMEMEDTLDG